MDKNLNICYNMLRKMSKEKKMNNKEKQIIKVFESAGGYATSKKVRARGIHPRYFKSALDDKIITKIKPGIYKLTNTINTANQGFVDISYAVPDGVICLLSALSYYELTTFNPRVIYVAIKRKSWRPKIEYPPVKFYYFSEKQFEAGIDTIIINKHKVRIYCKEKTICDCFRYRNKLGIDIAKEALSEYLKRKDRDLEKLMKYAKICRVESIMKIWISATI